MHRSIINKFNRKRTGANYKLIKDKPIQSLLNFKFILSVMGQFIIQIAFQTCFFYYFIMKRVNIDEVMLDSSGNQIEPYIVTSVGLNF